MVQITVKQAYGRIESELAVFFSEFQLARNIQSLIETESLRYCKDG